MGSFMPNILYEDRNLRACFSRAEATVKLIVAFL